MDARKITIVSTTNAQTKKVIMSAATTLGELKADLRTAGIDYENMDFFEGLSKTKLIKDSSLLPKDIPYKGTVTNELVFMLTTSRKKIESGYMYDREYDHEDIEYLKQQLKEAIEEYFEKDVDHVTNEEMIDFLNEIRETPVTLLGQIDNAMISTVANALMQLTTVLYEYDVINRKDVNSIRHLLNSIGAEEEKNIIPSPYEDTELDDILDEIF
jgi:hypothetical protein